MTASETFLTNLDRAFDGRVRCRWSNATQSFHIEQKVGRALVPPLFIEDGRDDLIRARDGYHPVMEIREGDRMPCPSCRSELKVPVRDTADIRCGYCQLKGRTTRVVAGFWPLDDSLIDHLRKIDPYRDGFDELAAEADAHNQRLMKSAENKLSDVVTSKADEDYRRLVGIPMVGYTGKEFK